MNNKRLSSSFAETNTDVVQLVYNHYRSPEVDDVEVLAAAATKHLKLLKEKDMAFIIEVAN